MKRIVLLVTLFIFVFGSANCFAAVSKEKAEQFLDGCAGSTMWFNRRDCVWTALKYLEKSEMMMPINMATSNKLIAKSDVYRGIYKSFQHLEEATVGIIDFDNHIVLINKKDGTVVTIKCASNDDLIELFTSMIIMIDNPFDHGESAQEISDIKNG